MWEIFYLSPLTPILYFLPCVLQSNVIIRVYISSIQEETSKRTYIKEHLDTSQVVYNYDSIQHYVCVTLEFNEGMECSPVHKAWQMSDNFYTNRITSELDGSWDCAGMRLQGWKKTYKNCLILPIPTRYIFFSIAQFIITS